MRGSSVCVLYHSEREEASGDSGDVVGGGAWTVAGGQDNGPAGGTSSSEWGKNPFSHTFLLLPNTVKDF